MQSSADREEPPSSGTGGRHPTADDIQRYTRCMEEIKRRYVVIGRFLYEGATTGFPMTDTELICLQFRKILELIALSSLCAHRAHYERVIRKFHKEWNARDILTEIERINPHFYPVPTLQVPDPSTGKVTEWKDVEEGFLTQDEFIRCHGECGNLLHAENPYSRNQINLEDWKAKFRDWYAKIMRLLNHHQVQLVETDQLLVTVMKDERDGKVYAYEFVRVSEGQLSTPPPSPPPPSS